MNWYIRVLKKYAIFDGRASRTEYWMFILFHIAITFFLAIVTGILGSISNTDQGVLNLIYSLATLIPSYTVAIRRMHDTDHSGWWMLVPIVSFIFACQKGTEGENRFGSQPRL